MTPIKLRNASKAPIVDSRPIPREGTHPGAKQSVVSPGTVGEFDGDNPSIRIYAQGGVLVPSDAVSKKWAAEL